MSEHQHVQQHTSQSNHHIDLALPKSTIYIVGTSHIAEASAKKIRAAADTLQPDIIAIELDANRLQALKDKAAGKKDERLPLSMIKQIGATGYVFAVIAKTLQQKMGGMVKVQPGVDMLEGVKIAESKNLHLALIDQDIQVTLQKLSREFTFKEKMRVVWDITSAPFNKKKYKIDLSKIPEEKIIEELMGILKNRYPNLHKVLVIDRNIVMARNLDGLVRKHPGKKILLIIGAGHEHDLRWRLKHLEHLANIA